MNIKGLFCVIVLAFTSLHANSIDDFCLSLDETTKLATKSCLNVDYVPGTMSIVKGEELLAIGITDLSSPNALDSVVGMESISSSLRGTGALYGGLGNKIQWMINGVAFDTQIGGGQLSGKAPLLFPIPVAFIDRIEIIRGAGSALYGGNAIFGVVNIVTKKGQNSVFTTFANKGGNNTSKTLGTLGNYKQGSVTVDVKASITQDDGYDLFVGKEGRFASSLWGSAPITGYAAGKIPNYSIGKNFSLDMKGKALSSWLTILETQSGQGLTGWSPTDPLPAYNGTYVNKERYVLGGVGYQTNIGKNSLNVKLGVNYYTFDMNGYMKFPLTTTAGDGVINRRYSEQTSYLSVENQRKFDTHTVTWGAEAKEVKVLDDREDQFYSLGYTAPVAPSPFFIWSVTPLATPTHSSLFDRKPQRYQWATFLQDEWQIDDDFILITGGRFDSINDIGSAFSPRVATVYYYDTAHIFKSQLSRSFRAPNFLETYRQGYVPEAMKPETVDTVEMSYIYKISQLTLKTTIFYSQIHNMIARQDYSGSFINFKEDSTINGLEVEGEKRWKDHKVVFNVARYDTHHPEDRFVNGSGAVFLTQSGKFALAPEWMGSLAWTINPSSPYASTLSVHYIGEKPRRNGETTVNNVLVYDDNGKIKSYEYLNFTQKIESEDHHWRGVIGIHNLLDKELQTLYAPLSGRPLDRSSQWPSNTLDIPYARRMVFLNIAYNF